MKYPHLLASLLIFTLSAPIVMAGPLDTGDVIVEALEIEPVWAGHPVGFSILTTGTHQFIAYYDADRQMTVAHRDTALPEFTTQKLPSHVVWDAHNFITMVVDDDGHLHVAGNMHCVPLIYFRTTRPYDVTSLERVEVMADKVLEQRMTYPVFLRGPKKELIYKYRDGHSGRGNDVFLVYDHATRTWSNLMGGLLLDGEGKRNGYFSTPKLGPDGYFHTVGVWRDTSGAELNHDLSYARSRDLIQWETGGGTPLELPLLLSNIDIVDPVPVRGGIINGCPHLGFDSKHRAIITFHKYDADGWTQVYAARYEDGAWKIRKVSDWEGYRWDFGGGGSIPFEVSVGAVKVEDAGELSLRFSNKKLGGTTILLDEETLEVLGPMPSAKRKPGLVLPGFISQVESEFPGMAKRRAWDIGDPGPGVRYFMSWETLGPHRDRPREGDLPEPSMLRLYKAREPGE